MTADPRVTYNPATHRLELGGPDDRTFLTVTRPFWLSQEVMDQVLQSLVEAVRERDQLEIALRDLHEGRV